MQTKLSLSVLSALTGVLLLSSAAFADQTVRIPQNQNTITLQLNANATTGYQWFLENYNQTYFTYLGYHYLAPQKADPKMTGVPGLAQFTFQVNPAFHQGPLTSKIHLIYGQPWDMTATTETTITLVSQPPVEMPIDGKVEAPTPPPVAAPAAASIPSPSPDEMNDDSSPTMATVGDPKLPAPSDSKGHADWLSLPKNQTNQTDQSSPQA